MAKKTLRERSISLEIKITYNYDKFYRSESNRTLDISTHKRLAKSLDLYGMLPYWPVVCSPKDFNGLREIFDGQHRWEHARHMGLPVYFIETDETQYPTFDIAVINDTQKTWTIDDYIQVYAEAGNEDYLKLIEFSRKHGLTSTVASGLLSGRKPGGSVVNTVKAGLFKVTDEEHATCIASLYNELDSLKSFRLRTVILGALQIMFNIPEFDPFRLSQSAKTHSEKLEQITTEDEAAQMLSELYNFRRQNKQLFPLKFEYDKIKRDMRNSVRKLDTVNEEQDEEEYEEE